MDWFEPAPKLVVNSDQFIAYMVFVKGLMHDPTPCNHPIPSYLVVGRIEKYQIAYPILSRFLKLLALKGIYSFSNQENIQETKQLRHDKKKFLESQPYLF